MKQKEEELGKHSKQKVKVIEKTGTREEHLLCSSDPWGETECGREDCLMCETATEEKEVGK